VLWRIDPEGHTVPRPIDVGFGVTAIAYGAGSIWVTNFVSDEVLRVDPRTNKVASRIALAGTPPSVAADENGAWVSVAGAPHGETLPTSMCGPVESRGGRPEKCASNARAYAATERVVGVVGPFQSPCAWAQIPIANRAEGPLAMISPSNTHPGLTHAVAGGSHGEEPGVYYPTGVRNYFRVTGAADVDGAAGAVLAEELDLRRVFVVRPEGMGEETTAPFTREARRLGIEIAGTAQWRPDAERHEALAARVAAARPDGVFIGGGLFANGDGVVKGLRARLRRKVVLIASDSFQPPSLLLEFAGQAAVGMYTTTTAIAHEGLGAAGKRFARDFRREHGVPLPSALYSIETAAAAEALLAAIARSDGTRASVIEELRNLELEDGILDHIRFDRNGDVTPAAFTVLRITGGTKRDPALSEDFTGAVVDRVVRVPAQLTRP
jgi:branched-chain amino acid transport system substrate-binding protein